MQQQLGLPAKFYIMKIGHNLGDLHEKALKVPKLNQFTLLSLHFVLFFSV